MSRTVTAVLLVALSAAAIAVRIVPGDYAIEGKQIRPFPDDAPYHMLRMGRIVTGHFDFRQPDPLVGHPEGVIPHWPWGFDRLLAAMVAPFTGSDPEPGALAFALFLAIPLLGAMLVPLVWWFGRRASGPGTALVAAAVTAFLPAHVVYSLFGRVDHHVLEPLAVVLALMGPVFLLSRGHRSNAGFRESAGCAASGLVLGFSFSAVPVMLAPAGLILAVMGLALARIAPATAVVFALSTVAGMIASLGMSPHPVAWVFHSPSLLQVTLLAIVAAGIVSVAAASRRPTGFAFGIGGLVAGLAFLAAMIAITPFRGALLDGFGFLGGSGIASMVHESQPLLIDVAHSSRLLGWLAPLAVIGSLAVIHARFRNRNLPGNHAVPMALLSIAFLSLAVFQRRFLMLATPLFALALADGLAWAGGLLAPIARRLGIRPMVSRAAAATIILAGFTPAIVHLANLEPLAPQDRAMYRAAEALADTARPGDGAFVPWSYGHVFQFSAGLPTMCDNFFGAPEHDVGFMRCLDLAYRTDPAEITRLLDEWRIRYVVVIPPHPERVRVESRVLGHQHNRWVDDQGRFRPEFARTFWVTLGAWGQNASPGDSGPFGLAFRGRFTEVDAVSRATEAEVLVFERIAAQPDPHFPVIGAQ
jgi:hypothetical protein